MTHLKNAQSIGNRRVDIHGFTRNTSALVGSHRVQRPHIVQTVGELNDDNADILYHRQHHFTKIFGLRLGLAAKIDLRQFADAIDQFGYFFAEFLYQVFFKRWRIFDHVMQYRSNDTVGVHAHFTENSGHRHGMADIGFAGNTTLSFVGTRTKQIGAIYVLDLLGF